MRKFPLAPLQVLVVCLLSLPASATLIGDEVEATLEAYSVTWLDGDTATVADPGVEFAVQTSSQLITNDVAIDLNASQITILFTLASSSLPVPMPNLASNHIFTLADLNWVDMPTGIIVGLSLVSSNFDLDPSVSDVTDHGFVITVSASNSYQSDGNGGFNTMIATWDIVTEHEVIPEPMTMALVGAGAIGMATQRRRLR